MQAAAFRRRIQHNFLQQKRFYDEQCAPLFKTLHPNTLEWILTPKLAPLVRSRKGEVYGSMREALDDHNRTYMLAHALRDSAADKSGTNTTLNIHSTTNLLGSSFNIGGAANNNASSTANIAAALGKSASAAALQKLSPADATTLALSGMGMSPVGNQNSGIVMGVTQTEAAGKKGKGKAKAAGKKKGGKKGTELAFAGKSPSTANNNNNLISLAPPQMMINSNTNNNSTLIDFDPTLPVVGDDPHLLISGLKWLTNAQRRLEASRLRSFTHQNYEFQIGDVVYQRQLGQVGVVADRLPVCFETDEWVSNQLGSAGDPRLRHPWYFLLVASHQDLPVDMTRYGSALTHTRTSQKMSIGFHSLLPLYFEGYDAEKGVYIPRKDRHQLSNNRLSRVGKSQEISISWFLRENPPNPTTVEEGVRQS